MKKLMYGVLIGIVLVIIFIAGTYTKGTPILSYVYSNSMEPLIKVNDAFIVWPKSNYQLGDIIMYRPVVLEALYITHRILAIGDTGFITKGDNAPYRDQESGEPEVKLDSVIGKVVTVHGQPLVIPGLGRVSKVVQSKIGRNTRYLSALFIALGLIIAIVGGRSTTRRRKPRRRLRLHHIYRLIVIIIVLSGVISIFLGSRVTQIKYLVSEYPGTLGDEVEVNRPGHLIMELSNNGLVPVWTIMKGIAPLSVSKEPEYLLPLSKKRVVIDVLPQRQTGIYQGYVQIYNYPILFPKAWLTYLHRLHPALAIAATGLALGLWITLLFKILNHVHGFEGWIPLAAIKDKITSRRLKRAKAKIVGRRRDR